MLTRHDHGSSPRRNSLNYGTKIKSCTQDWHSSPAPFHQFAMARLLYFLILERGRSSRASARRRAPPRIRHVLRRISAHSTTLAAGRFNHTGGGKLVPGRPCAGSAPALVAGIATRSAGRPARRRREKRGQV